MFYVLLLLLLFAPPLHAASVADDLFKGALLMESVDRDLDGAIHLYQKVLTQPGASRALKAETRLRMGICYEKLGKHVDAAAQYRQILAEPVGASSTVLQQTRTNLVRIQAEHPVVAGEKGPQVPKRRFVLSRFSLLMGPSLLLSNNGMPVTGLSTALRYRTSTDDRRLPWYLEVSGKLPLGGSTVGDQAEPFGSQGNDRASLSLNYQCSLGFVGELPHGQQRKLIPEAGLGAALTSAKISYANASSSGEEIHNTLSPYVEAGLHLFPDKIISGLFRIRYLTTPYPTSVDIQSPPHSQNFNFPSSQWELGLAFQIKIGQVVREPHR